MRSKAINKDGSKVILCSKKTNPIELTYDLIDRKNGIFVAQLNSSEMNEIFNFVGECKILDNEDKLLRLKARYDSGKDMIDFHKSTIVNTQKRLENISENNEEYQLLSKTITSSRDNIDSDVIDLDYLKKEIKELEEEIRRLKTTF